MVFATIDFAVMLAYVGVGVGVGVGARAVRALRSSATKWLDPICGGTLPGLAAPLYRRATN